MWDAGSGKWDAGYGGYDMRDMGGIWGGIWGI